MIRHVWFDFSETIAFLNKEHHDRLCHETYAQIVGHPVDEVLIDEYKQLYKKFSHSNAAIFRSLGLAPNFWSEKINTIDPAELYTLADPHIPDVLQSIKSFLPISLFSNIQLDRILPALGIDPSWFVHVLSSSVLTEPKPALEGFYKMIELSNVPPDELLYIGDHVEKDVLPAKRVGMKAGIIWSSSEEADYTFKSFNEILSLIESEKK